MGESAFMDLAHQSFHNAMVENGIKEDLWNKAKIYNDTGDSYLVMNGNDWLRDKNGSPIRFSVNLNSMMQPQQQAAPGQATPGQPAQANPQPANDWIGWLGNQQGVADANKRAIAEARAKAYGTTVESEMNRWQLGMPKEIK